MVESQDEEYARRLRVVGSFELFHLHRLTKCRMAKLSQVLIDRAGPALI